MKMIELKKNYYVNVEKIIGINIHKEEIEILLSDSHFLLKIKNDELTDMAKIFLTKINITSFKEA